jgi:hypothetical protein
MFVRVHVRAHALCVQLADNCKQDYNECDGGHLVASPDTRREQQRVCRRPEDIAVHLFPPVFIAQVALLYART